MVIVSRLVAALALLVLLVSCMNMIGCCAIDCERFPEQCEANRRAQSTAALTGLASFVVFVGSLAASFRMRRRARLAEQRLKLH
jgi:CRISPR/Cas system endoribonuclease Cas6 (RAMP superfamily)